MSERRRGGREWLVGALLLLYPRAFRVRFGDEVRAHVRTARASARWRAHPLRFRIALLRDTLRAAPRAWMDVARNAESLPASRSEPMSTLLKDVRYAARTLAHRPGFTLAATLTLALGIGATSAIYSVVSAVLLRAMPYPDADRLVAVWTHGTSGGDLVVSYPDFLDWQQRARSFEALAITRPISVNLTGLEHPDRLIGNYASANTFALLGIRPALGRLFTDRESAQGTAEPVIVLSDGAWADRFARDPHVLGRTLTLNGTPMTVIGVTPPDVHPPYVDPEVWIPIGLYRTLDRGNASMLVMGRLRRGVSIEKAQRELAGIARALEREYPATNTGVGVRVRSLHAQLFGDVRPALVTLLAAVALVLLIAAFNVANLQLARAATRRVEFAVRAALGASRGRVIRQLLTESTLLSLAGGALGVLLAVWGVRAIRPLIPSSVFYYGTIAVDRPVLAVTLVLTLITGVGCGLAPALGAARADLASTLRLRSSVARRVLAGLTTRDVLVVAQVALSLVLLIGAGLLLRTVIALRGAALGFDAANVVTMEFRLPPTKYPTPAQQDAFMVRALEEIRRVPGVTGAAMVRALPLSGNFGVTTYEVDGRPPRGSDAPSALADDVTPGYFGTMGIPVIAGRDFDARDRTDALPVAIVSARLARVEWPEASALGQRVKLRGDSVWRTIVGVVGDAKHFTLADSALAAVYTPYAQAPAIFSTVVARTSGPAEAMGGAVRDAIWRVDPDQPVWKIRTMSALVDRARGQPRFMTMLVGLFAVLAAVLAAIGVYGVLSYSVAQRTREIGVRMAFGARGGDVMRLVMWRGASLTLGAIAIGSLGALAATRLLRSQLWGVRPLDPWTFGLVPALLLVVALVATFLPARRAARLPPTIALRDGEG